MLLPLILTCFLGCEESTQQKKMRLAKSRVDSCIKSANEGANEEERKLVGSVCKTLQIELDKIKEKNN